MLWRYLKYLSLGLLCLLIGGLALAGWYGAGADARALKARGVETQATVTDLHRTVRIRTTNSAGGRSYSFFATVGFVSGSALDNSLTLHTARRAVSEDFFGTLAKGQKIPVRYLPDDPDTVEIEPGWVEGNSVAAGWVAAGFLPPGLIALVLGWRMAGREQRILTRGIPRQGDVIDLVTNQGFWILRFRWRGGDGGQYEGRAKWDKRADRFAGLVPGGPIDLIEDPLRPDRAIWTGDLRKSRA